MNPGWSIFRFHPVQLALYERERRVLCSLSSGRGCSQVVTPLQAALVTHSHVSFRSSCLVGPKKPKEAILFAGGALNERKVLMLLAFRPPASKWASRLWKTATGSENIASLQFVENVPYVFLIVLPHLALTWTCHGTGKPVCFP